MNVEIFDSMESAAHEKCVQIPFFMDFWDVFVTVDKENGNDVLYVNL